MSVLQPISYGLVHQIGPGSGARGFGSYKADNTETISPYQQESSSPVGRAYPMGIVSGSPTVYDPRAGIQEDPVVVLLKKILGMKTVVEKKPGAGFKTTVSVGSDSGMNGGGNTLGQAPTERTYDDSTDYGSLNEFKDELKKLTTDQKIDGWFNDLKEAVSYNDIGVSTTPAFGTDVSTSTNMDMKTLDDLINMYHDQIDGYERDSGYLRNAANYIAKMVDYLRLTPLSYEDVDILKEGNDPVEISRIIDDIKESYKTELTKRVKEASAIVMAGDEEITKKKNLSDASTQAIYEGANAFEARPGVADNGRPPMVSTGAGYSVRSRAGRFENPQRRASVSSSTSGNSSGVSFDPKNPDTSNAFKRTSIKKKKFTKKK